MRNPAMRVAAFRRVPGAINVTQPPLPPTLSQNSRIYETNDVPTAEEPVTFSAGVLYTSLQFVNITIPVNIGAR